MALGRWRHRSPALRRAEGRPCAIARRDGAALAPTAADREAAASLLHNLAGTASYFDEDELGMLSAENEQPARFVIDRAGVTAIADRLLPLLTA